MALLAGDLIEGVVSWSRLDVSAWDGDLQQEYAQIPDRFWRQPWEEAFLRRIDALLLVDDRGPVGELLKIMSEIIENHHEKRENRTDWSKINRIYAKNINNSEDINIEEILKEINKIWDLFDIEARELIACLLDLIIDAKNKEAVAQFLAETKKRRRLGLHPLIKKHFPGVYVLPEYRWPFFLVLPPPLPPDIKQWLRDGPGLETSPFYPGIAEFEQSIRQRYHRPANVDFLRDQTSLWIRSARGAGRTALARYLCEDAIENGKSAAVHLSWAQPDCYSGKGEWDMIETIAEAMAQMWVRLLRHNPEAFLDLPSAQQRGVALLLRHAIGAIDEIGLAVGSEGGAIDEIGLAVGAERGTRQKQLLWARLRMFLDEMPVSPPATAASYKEMCALRPAGLQATYVIIEFQEPVPENCARALIHLAMEMCLRQVFMKIIALQAPAATIPSWELQWTPAELEKMLRKGAENLFHPDLLQFLTHSADGSPRKLMELGQLALSQHIRREPENNNIEQEDIELAILRYQQLHPFAYVS